MSDTNSGGAAGEIEVSIVIPFYNEEKSVETLYRGVREVMDPTGRPYEMILVDDGSRDGTPAILRRLFEADPRVTVVRLRRNCGQTAALAAGFDRARGEIIISMDGDLQHDPKEIPAFLGKMGEGFDVVSGWREHRVDNLLTRRIPSWAANRLMGLLSGVEIHDFGTTFKAYRRDIIKNIELYGEMHRFIPALASSMGARIVEIPIRNIPRATGKSNYGLSRTRRVFLDLILVKFFISYLANPLRIFGTWGILTFFMGLGIAVGLLLWYVRTGLNIAAYHEGLLILSVLAMLLGVQFITMGLIGEIVARIYHRIGRKTAYVLERIYEHPAAERR